MTKDFLVSIAEIISANSKTYYATVPDEKQPYAIVAGKELDTVSCYAILMTLVDRPKNHTYRKGCYVYEKDIERAVKRMSQKDKKFEERIINGNLTLLDIEIIIRQASNQIIKPNLSKTALDLYNDNM